MAIPVTANAPLIEVLSKEVVPATVKLSDNVVTPATPNVPPIEVLLRFKLFVTVKLFIVVLSSVVIPETRKIHLPLHYPVH